MDVYIGRLRREIEEDPRHPRIVRTVRGRGYRLAAASSDRHVSA